MRKSSLINFNPLKIHATICSDVPSPQEALCLARAAGTDVVSLLVPCNLERAWNRVQGTLQSGTHNLQDSGGGSTALATLAGPQRLPS